MLEYNTKANPSNRFQIEPDICVLFRGARKVLLRFYDDYDIDLPLEFENTRYYAFYEPALRKLVIYAGEREDFLVIQVSDTNFSMTIVPFQYQNDDDGWAIDVSARFLPDGHVFILCFHGLYAISPTNNLKWACDMNSNFHDFETVTDKLLTFKPLTEPEGSFIQISATTGAQIDKN